jgi:hypothetical protein
MDIKKPLFSALWSHFNGVMSKPIFCVRITLGNDIDISFVTVPIDSLVHPLCVIPDIGGEPAHYFVVLPKSNWSRYFGDRIHTN